MGIKKVYINTIIIQAYHFEYFLSWHTLICLIMLSRV